MIAVKKVGEFYYEFWLEEGERQLMQRMFAIPSTDNCMVIVTIVRKGLDTRDLQPNVLQPGTTHDDTGYLFECHDIDHP